MKKWMYSQHDKLAKFYNVVQVSDLDPQQFSTNLARSIQLCKDPSKLGAISDCELVCVGFYDDETMKFEIAESPEVLLDCSKLVEEQYARYASNNK